MRYPFFLDVTLCYWVFGFWLLRQRSDIIFRSHNVPENEEPSLYFHRSIHSLAFAFAISPLKIGLICCFDTAGTKYPVTQHHIPEEWTPQPVFREIQNSENVFAAQQNLLNSATRKERKLRVLCNFIGPRPLPFKDNTHKLLDAVTVYKRLIKTPQNALKTCSGPRQCSHRCWNYWHVTCPSATPSTHAPKTTVKLSLRLISASRQEDVARTGGTAPPFLSPALDG